MSFTKRSLGTKWYSGTNPQDAMYQNAKQHDHKACLVKIDNDDGYRSYGSYISWDEAIVHLQTLDDKVRKQHFELLPEDKPCKPYFDFDYRYDSKSTIKYGDINISDFRINVENTLRPVLQNLTVCSPSSPALNNCFIWTDSSSSAKFSLHLVIHLELEKEEMKELWLCKSTERAKYFCTEMLRISPELGMFSDTKVYTRNRTMRMCGSSKHGKEEKLQLLDLPLTKENLMRTTITWFGETSKLFPIPGDELIKTELKKDLHSDVNNICAIDDADYEKLTKFIEEIKMQANLITSIKLIRGNIDTITIGLKTRWCPNIKREHSSQHQYGVLSKHGLVFKCQDADCVDFKFGKINFKNLPADIRTLCNTYLQKLQTDPVNSLTEQIAKLKTTSFVNKITQAEIEMSAIINEDLELDNNPNWRVEQTNKRISATQNKWFRENDMSCLNDKSYIHAHPGQCGIECKKHKLLVGCLMNGQMDKSKEYKRWLDHIPHCIEKHKMEINMNVSGSISITDTDLSKLLEIMWNKAETQTLRLGSDCVFVPVAGKPRVYIQSHLFRDWIKLNFIDEALLLAEPSRMDKMEQALRNGCKSAVPDIKIDQNVMGFRNGILHLDSCKFVTYDAITDSDTTVVRHYIDQDLDVEKQDTSALDTILQFQIRNGSLDEDDDEPDYIAIEWIMAMLGRLLFPIGLYDRMEITPYIWGLSDTGKSCLGHLVEHFYHSTQVGTMSKTMEAQFGLESWYQKQVIICFETPDDINSVLDHTIFQSMTSGERVSVARKKMSAVDVVWTTPLLLLGNKRKTWRDNGGESISKRLVSIPFTRKPRKDLTLYSRMIHQQLPAIIYKCVKYYHQHLTMKEDVVVQRDFWEICPQYFRNRKLEALEVNNPFLSWLRSSSSENGIFREEGCITIWEEFKNYVSEQNQGPKKLVIGDANLATANITVTKKHFCGVCQKAVYKAKTCCPEYKRTSRTTKNVVLGIRLRCQE